MADAPVPIDAPTMPMYAIWHLRHQQDPAHVWLRAQLQTVLKGLLPKM
jgi:DNA-binding transcriptional LysR family regulator